MRMTGEPSRSDELDQVRRLLFPELPAEEGWARIDAAIAGAAAEPHGPTDEPPGGAPELPAELLEQLREALRDAQ
jgi:hypothetical protein